MRDAALFLEGFGAAATNGETVPPSAATAAWSVLSFRLLRSRLKGVATSVASSASVASAASVASSASSATPRFVASFAAALAALEAALAAFISPYFRAALARASSSALSLCSSASALASDSRAAASDPWGACLVLTIRRAVVALPRCCGPPWGVMECAEAKVRLKTADMLS